MVAVEIFDLSEHLPYGEIFPNGVVQIEGNGLTATIEYRGPNFETTPNDALLSLLLRIQGYLAQFGRQEGWSIAANTAIVPASPYLTPPSWISEDRWSYDPSLTDCGHIDRCRAQRFSTKLIEERHFLSITMRPIHAKAQWLDKVLKEGVEEKERAWGPYVDSFYEVLDVICSAFSKDFSPSGFARILNADQWLAVHSFNIDGIEKNQVRFPKGAKSFPVRTLVNRYVKYGRKIRLDGLPECHVRVIGVAGAPDNHHPELMHALTKCNAPMRVSQRFIVYPSEILQAYYRKSMADAKDSSKSLFKHFLSMIPSLKELSHADSIGMAQYLKAEADAAGSAFIKSGGPLTTSVIIYDDNERAADERAQDVVKVLKSDVEYGGFNTIVEDVGVQAAYIGSFPGTVHCYKRFDVLPEYYLAARMRITSPWTGANRSKSPWGGPPIMQGVVDGNRPFRFDPWFTGEWGHMVCLGPTRSGKSSWMRLLASQWRSRFKKGKVIDIDADAQHSASVVACLAAAGTFFSMDGESSRLQPFRNIDTSDQFVARVGLVENMCQAQGIEYSGEINDAINDAMRLLKSEPKTNRTVSTLRDLVANDAVEGALKPYCKGGVWGHIMDGRRDPIPSSKQILIELGSIARKDSPAARPVIEAMLLAVEDTIERGTQTLVLIDETKICVRAMGPRLIEWLARLAKLKACAVLSLHFLDDEGEDSTLVKAILEQCHTKLVFPSAKATQPATRKWMEPLGVSDTMARKIAASTKGNVCVLQGAYASMVDFALGPEELALCATDGEEANRRAIEIFNRSTKEKFWKDILASKELYQDGETHYAIAAE